MPFTAVYMKVPEGYIAFIEELPGANTQGATLEEARENLREAVELVAGRVPLEASGGVNLETIRDIAEAGVNYISVGRITQ